MNRIINFFRKIFSLEKTYRTILYALLLLFVVFDLSNSFKQFHVSNLDGDIVESTLLLSGVQKTVSDPTGIKTIIHNDKHPIPNRFFSHYFLHKTFSKLPRFLQNFCEPIDSVYLSVAITKLTIQILLLFLMSVIVSGKARLFSLKFIMSAAFLIPFFQTNGRALSNEIGIIPSSVSYCFYYPLPFIFLLLYYMPLCFELLHNKKIKMNWILIILWTVFAIVSCFSGALNSPVILITNLILFLYIFIKNWKVNENQSFLKRSLSTLKIIPKRMYWFLFPVCILALYSFFLGRYDNAFSEIQLSLKELYLLLPKGILNSFFISISYSIILFLLLANFLIIFFKYQNEPQSKKIIDFYKFFIVFLLLYVLLLPLGGYRPYRPLILRFDTILPITILAMLTITYGFLFILKKLVTEKWTYYLKIVYPAFFLMIMIFFTFRDNIVVRNECEKASLYIISNSKEDIVILDNDCSVVGWEPIYTPEESKNYGELLYLWNITDKPKLFYNQPRVNENQ